MINNFIRIYILSDFPIKKNYSISLISKLYYQNLRNLQQQKEGQNATIILYATEDFDKDTIAVFSSKNEFNNIKRIEGQEVRFDNEGYNAIINLLDNNKDCLDTEKVENRINQGGLDYSNLPSDYKINQYKINSASQGCNFDLESNSIIKNEEKKQIKLNFKNDKSGDINADCILSKNNEKANLIPCTLNKNVDSNYVLEDYIQSNNKEILTIIQSNKSAELYLNCSLNLKAKYHKSGKGGLKIGVIICIIIVAILLLLGVTFLALHFRNKNKGENLDNIKTNTNNMLSAPSSTTSIIKKNNIYY